MTKSNVVTLRQPIEGVVVKDPAFFRQLDALQNFAANFGTGSDKRMHTEYVEQYLLDPRTLEALYAENWLVGKIVDIVPDDMTREWRLFDSSLDPKKVEEFTQFEEDLNVVAKFNEAQKWGRLYGGAGIVLGIDEAQGGPANTPLNIDGLGKDCLRHIQVIECERLQAVPDRLILDPTQPGFGEPEYYMVPGSSAWIHRSRVLPFYGLKLSYYPKARQRMAYWGASIVRRLYESVVAADLSVAGAASLVSEASHDVIKYKGLTQFLLQPGGEEKLQNRFALMKLLKSVNNVTLLDEDETFENHQQTFSGLGDLLDRFWGAVAGAGDIPATRLLGSAAKGLNATGEGDMKNYYDNVRASQNRDFNPNLRTLDKIMQRSLWGSEMEDWNYEWASLFQLSEKEQAEMENQRANRDKVYLDSGVLDELVIAKQLYKDGTYNNIDQTYLDQLKTRMEEAEKAQEEAMLELPGERPRDDDGQDPNAPRDDLLELA